MVASRLGVALLACGLLIAKASAAAAPAGPAARQLAGLRTMDARLATIGFRLATANAPLCDVRQPGAGMVLHAIDQYAPSVRAAAREVFGFEAPVSVELVVPGSPADRGGVEPGDGLLAVGGIALPAAGQGAATGATRDAALALIAGRDPGRPLVLSLVRAGWALTVTLPALPACRAEFEMLPGAAPVARSDGRIVQVGGRTLERLGDDRLAFVVAHELAHIVLRHRARLEVAGVRWGMAAEFGRSARLVRVAEDEADALGAVLMRNAGYDPRAAMAFWRAREGGLEWVGSHSSARHREDAVAAAVAAIPPTAPMPWVPPLIATRDQPPR